MEKLMEKKVPIFKNIFFNLIVFAVCCSSTFIAIFGNNEIYNTLWLLPLGYAIIYLFSLTLLKDEVFSNIGYILFWGQSIMKCVIAPAILCIGNYTSLFGNLKGRYIFQAVLLMLYEQLICTLVIAFGSKDRKRIKFILPNKIRLFKLKFRSFILIFATLMVGIWLLVPTVRNNFVTVFDMFSSHQMFLGYDYILVTSQGLDRILTTLFLVLFKSFRIIFPFYLSYPESWLREAQLYDRTMVSYRASRGGKVRIVYKMRQDGVDDLGYQSESLTPMYEDIYVKDFILYKGDLVRYYFQETRGKKQITQEENVLEQTRDVPPVGRYGKLNAMSGMEPDERREAMEAYQQEIWLADRIFEES